MENKEVQRQEQSQRGRKSATLLLLLILLVTITVGFAVLSTSLKIKGTSTIKGGWCVGIKCGGCDNIETCQDPPIVCPTGENCVITDCDKNPSKCDCDATSGECTMPEVDCTTNPEKCDCDTTTGKCTPKPRIWLKGDTIYFDHTLEKPGDVFTFDATYTNGGDIDAAVKNIVKNDLNTTAQKFMTYDVTYSPSGAINDNDALNAGSSRTFKVTVAYKSTVTTAPTEAELAEINETAQGHHGASSFFQVNYEQK